jgi:hypothetical protein
MGREKDLSQTAQKSAIRGQTLTEYALIMLFVGLAAFSAYLGLGRAITVVSSNLATDLNAAISAL